MNVLRHVLAVYLALVCAVSAAQTASVINDAARKLLDEGNVLLTQGKMGEALSRFSDSAKADPTASIPLSTMAETLRLASEQMQGEPQAKARRQAEEIARHALSKHGDDPIAQEVLRKLADNQSAPLHQPNAEATAELHRGELLFAQKKLDEALTHYERAAALDPKWSLPWIYAGDCFYFRKDLAEAEIRFRKGVEIEPLNAQGWRFLADALQAQRKFTAAEDALINGIAAQPSQMPNWTRLAQLRETAGYPLTSLAMVRYSSASIDASGKPLVKLDGRFGKDNPKQMTDGAVWLFLATKEANDLHAAKESKEQGQPFAQEAARWHDAMKVVDEIVANGGVELDTTPLKTMYMLNKSGTLDTALLLLQYRESWRAEFEAWKKENPQGIRTFINTYGLRP